MSTLQTRTRFIRFGIKARSRTGIDNLRRLLVANDQYVSQTLDDVSVKCGIKITFRQRDITLLKRQVITLPARQTACQN